MALAYATFLAPPAPAQEASDPLTFEVRPSGVETETPEEKLDRRLKEREAMFRSICIQCGTLLRSESNAPFRPYDALSSRTPSAIARPSAGASRGSAAQAAPDDPGQPD